MIPLFLPPPTQPIALRPRIERQSKTFKFLTREGRQTIHALVFFIENMTTFLNIDYTYTYTLWGHRKRENKQKQKEKREKRGYIFVLQHDPRGIGEFVSVMLE
jgi:hypothetical protein